MHSLTSLKIVVELWYHPGTFGATCICLVFLECPTLFYYPCCSLRLRYATLEGSGDKNITKKHPILWSDTLPSNTDHINSATIILSASSRSTWWSWSNRLWYSPPTTTEAWTTSAPGKPDARPETSPGSPRTNRKRKRSSWFSNLLPQSPVRDLTIEQKFQLPLATRGGTSLGSGSKAQVEILACSK